MRGSKPKCFYSYDFLYDEYVNKRKTITLIAKELGCSITYLNCLLHKLKIPIRSISEAKLHNDCKLIVDYDVFIGSMLGDGSLNYRKIKNGLSVPYFTKSNIYYDHILYVANKIYPDHFESRIEHLVNNRGFSNFNGMIFRFTTKAHTELKRYQDEWYNDGTKIVPLNLVLTPGVVLNWFMDDGYYYKSNRCRNLGLCTQSFTKQENELLIDKLYTCFNLRCSVHKVIQEYNNVVKYRIYVLNNSILDFFDVIGECPVASLKYKWRV